MKQKIFQVFKTLIYIIIFIFLVENVGIYKSLAVYLLFVFITLLISMYRKRDLLLYKIKEAETIIFSKPLDRDKWEPGEMKRTKIKMVWRKKDNVNKKEIPGQNKRTKPKKEV